MCRQALAESEAWTPIESPWTLPTGLSGVYAFSRPASASTSQRQGLAHWFRGVALCQLGCKGLGRVLSRFGEVGSVFGQYLNDLGQHANGCEIIARTKTPEMST